MSVIDIIDLALQGLTSSPFQSVHANMEIEYFVFLSVTALTIAANNPAQAAGCLKGAVVSGIAGHHAEAGAVGGPGPNADPLLQ
jgi:hypothetical protein